MFLGIIHLVYAKMSKILTPALPQLSKNMYLRTPFTYLYILIVINIPQISTYFVLPSDMKQIVDGPTTRFIFIVPLIQKESINLIN